jgi:hypothetical protein
MNQSDSAMTLRKAILSRADRPRHSGEALHAPRSIGRGALEDRRARSEQASTVPLHWVDLFMETSQGATDVTDVIVGGRSCREG